MDSFPEMAPALAELILLAAACLALTAGVFPLNWPRMYARTSTC